MCALETSGVLVEFEAPPFIAVLVPPDPMLLSIRGNGDDFRFFRYGSTKSTLVPAGFPATILSWAEGFRNFSSCLLTCYHRLFIDVYSIYVQHDLI